MNINLIVFIQEIMYLKNAGVSVINIDEYKSIETHGIALYINGYNGSPSYIPKEIKKIIENKNIITYINRTKACDSIICGYFCIGFINFILKGESLLDYTNLFSPNEYKKINKIIAKYFQ